MALGGGGVLYTGCPERGEGSRKHNFEGDVWNVWSPKEYSFFVWNHLSQDYM